MGKGSDSGMPLFDRLVEAEVEEERARSAPRRGDKDNPLTVTEALKAANRALDSRIGTVWIEGDKGAIYVGNLPMVDQGNKGYCVAATVQRLFEYYGIGADMHQIAEIAGSDPRRGTSTLEMARKTVKLSRAHCSGVCVIEQMPIVQSL